MRWTSVQQAEVGKPWSTPQTEVPTEHRHGYWIERHNLDFIMHLQDREEMSIFKGWR